MEEIRLAEQVRFALTPTPAEMERMLARFQKSLQDEVAWRAFTTTMVQSSKNIQACIAHSQEAAVTAAQYHRLGG